MTGPGFGSLPSVPDYRLDPPEDDEHHNACPAHQEDGAKCTCDELDAGDACDAADARRDALLDR